MIFGEELGEFLMPPLRCFFLGDSAECWSSSTETAKKQWCETEQCLRMRGMKHHTFGIGREQHSTEV